MSTTRPASLDGSLLARKGDAAPAIANDSPLLEELGEPRPDRPVGRSGAIQTVADGSGAVLGMIGRGMTWLAGHPVYGVLVLAMGIAILFTVTIAALTPSSNSVSAPAVSTPVAAVGAPEEINNPTDGKSMTEPSDAVTETATMPSETVMVPPDTQARLVAPDPPAKLTLPEPAAAKPPAKPAVATIPSGRSGGYLLQLSAVPTAKAARSELARLESRLRSLLGNRKIVVVKAVPPGKPPVYRLRASAYGTRGAARAACKRIRKKNMACWVVKR